MMNDKLYGRVINWEEIPSESPRPGVSRKAYASEALMLVRNVLEEGLEVRPHSHDFDQLVHILEGRCDFFVEGERHAMGPGDLLLVPAHAQHHAAVTETPCVNIDYFVPPRADYAHLVSFLDENP